MSGMFQLYALTSRCLPVRFLSFAIFCCQSTGT